MNDKSKCPSTPAGKREVIEKLLVLWQKVPDWRLGQLIWNTYQGSDFFFVREDQFLKDIQNTIGDR
jgi:hypothetical protein